MPNINKQYKNLASKGRYGDTMLAHINPQEAGLLRSMGGAGTINPKTGLPEFYGIGQLQFLPKFTPEPLPSLGQALAPESLANLATQLNTTTVPAQGYRGMPDIIPASQQISSEYAQYADRAPATGQGGGRQIEGYTAPTDKTYQGIPLVAQYDAQGNFKQLTLERGQYLTPDPSRPNIQSIPRINAQGEITDFGIVDTDNLDNSIFGGFKELGTDLAPIILAALGSSYLSSSGFGTAGAGAAAGGAGVPGGLMGSTLPAGAGAGGFFAPGVTAGAATLGIPTMTGAPAGVTPSFAGGTSSLRIPTAAEMMVGSPGGPGGVTLPAVGAGMSLPTTSAGLLDFAAKNPSLVGGAIGAITGAVGAANAPKSTTTTASIDPDLKKEYLANIERAKETAAGLGVRQFEGFTPDYLKGQDQVINLGLGGKGQQTTDEAVRLAMIEAGFTPQQIQAATAGDASLANAQGYTAQQMQAANAGNASLANAQGYTAQQMAAAQAGDASLANAQGYTAQQMAAAQANRGNVANVGSVAGSQYMGAYQNPFEEQVVQGALADIERTRKIQEQANMEQATRARAFGGSRQAVVSGLTNEAAIRQAASTSGQLRSAGFTQAAQLGQTDAARALQAQLANQGIDVTLEQANTQLRQQGSLSNQAATNQALQFGAGATNQANLTNAAALNQMAQYNASMRQQGLLSNQSALNQAAQFGAGATNQANLTNAAALNQMAQYNASMRQQGLLSNQSALNQASQFGAGATNQANLSNAAALNQMAQYNASMRQQAALANQDAFAQGAGIRQAAIGQVGQLGAQQQNLGLTGANAVMEAQMREQALRQARLDAQRNIGMERLGITSGSLGIGIPNLGGSTSQPLYSSAAGSALSGGLTGAYIGGLLQPRG